MSSPFADHFSRIAAGYAECRPTYPRELFVWLASVTPRCRLAWDAGAGNGQATLGLAEHFVRVVGTDASAGQLRAAPRRARVSYCVGRAEASSLRTGSADLITVAQALHWFDLAEFYAEARRILAPDGLLAVWTYGIQRFDDPAVDRIVVRFYRETVGPFWPPARRMVEDGYATIAFPFVELAPPPFELTTRWSRSRFLGYVATWSATTGYRAERRVDPVPALEEELESHWPRDEIRRIRWPLAVRAGRPPT